MACDRELEECDAQRRQGGRHSARDAECGQGRSGGGAGQGAGEQAGEGVHALGKQSGRFWSGLPVKGCLKWCNKVVALDAYWRYQQRQRGGGIATRAGGDEGGSDGGGGVSGG